MRSRRGMPILGEHDRRPRRPGDRDLAIDDRDEIGSAVDRKAALRIGEIVLEIDDDEGRPPVVALHPPTLANAMTRKRDDGAAWAPSSGEGEGVGRADWLVDRSDGRLAAEDTGRGEDDGLEHGPADQSEQRGDVEDRAARSQVV